MTFYPLPGDKNELQGELRRIGCDEKAVSILNKKFSILPVKVIGMKACLANIVKQEMISCKGDAVVNEKTVSCTVEKTDVLLLGTESIYNDFFRKMEFQNSPALYDLAKKLKKMIDNYHNRVITARNNMALYSGPILMGILNITEDSFYDGGRYIDKSAALKRCEEMVSEGADIIDIGGESSRPGSLPVSAEIELERIMPVIESVSRNMKIVISVDTTKSVVADEALKAGASIINDISGMRFDEKMPETVKKHNARVIVMHMKGTPQDMQKAPFYEDVIRETVEYFDERIDFADKEGIPLENLIIDPGIGFGKRIEDNIRIIKNLSAYRKYGLPLLIGASRKSFIGTLLATDHGEPLPPEKRLFGTLGIHAAACMNGADILRVHDVKEHRDMLKMINYIK